MLRFVLALLVLPCLAACFSGEKASSKADVATGSSVPKPDAATVRTAASPTVFTAPTVTEDQFGTSQTETVDPCVNDGTGQAQKAILLGNDFSITCILSTGDIYITVLTVSDLGAYRKVKAEIDEVLPSFVKSAARRCSIFWSSPVLKDPQATYADGKLSRLFTRELALA